MYVSFVQDSVTMLNKILIESNFATQMSALYHASPQTTTDLNAEIKMNQNYISASSKNFTKVYIKLIDAKGTTISPQNMHATVIAKSLSNSGESNNVYKVRNICFRGATYKDKGTLEELISRAWFSKLQSSANVIANGAQLLAFNFTADIKDAWNSITTLGESVITVDYVVYLANRDPESLLIPEISISDFNSAIKTMGTPIKSCESDAFKNTRVYITGYDTLEKPDAVQQALSSVWQKANPNFGFLGARLNLGLKADSDFVDGSKKNVTRLSVWWTVDNTEPSALYFDAPKSSDIMSGLAALRFKQYDGVKYKQFKFYLGGTVDSDALLALVKKSWKAENPAFSEDAFDAMNVVQSQVNAGEISTKALSDGGVNKVGYYMGVSSNSESTDVSDVRVPSKETIQRIASAMKLDIQVYSELEAAGLLKQNSASTNNQQVQTAIIAGSIVGAVALIVLILIIVVVLCKKRSASLSMTNKNQTTGNRQTFYDTIGNEM